MVGPTHGIPCELCPPETPPWGGLEWVPVAVPSVPPQPESPRRQHVPLCSAAERLSRQSMVSVRKLPRPAGQPHLTCSSKAFSDQGLSQSLVQPGCSSDQTLWSRLTRFPPSCSNPYMGFEPGVAATCTWHNCPPSLQATGCCWDVVPAAAAPSRCGAAPGTTARTPAAEGWRCVGPASLPGTLARRHLAGTQVEQG